MGVGAGAAVSIAANILHALIPPDPRPADWQPQLGAVIGAVWWPVALFLAIEVMVSRLWPAGWLWRAARVLMAGPVTAVAAVVSYHHLSGLLAHWGEDGFTVTCGPVAVDGLMSLCSVLLYLAREPAAVPAVPPHADGEDQRDQTEDRRSRAADQPHEPDASPVPDETDPLLAAGLAVLADLDRADAVLTRSALIDGLRARDVKIGTGRATELLRQLRALPAAEPVLNGSARPPSARQF